MKLIYNEFCIKCPDDVEDVKMMIAESIRDKFHGLSVTRRVCAKNAGMQEAEFGRLLNHNHTAKKMRLDTLISVALSMGLTFEVGVK